MHAGEQSGPMAMVANKHYSAQETYWITHDAARTIRHFARLRARSKPFTERIMLAVTEVNGCALCAYGHTRIAHDAGLSSVEIRGLLGGVSDGVPQAELPAIMFAQHYADARGHLDASTWRTLVDVYGQDQALGILGTARMIMAGNAVGIPWSALLSRLRAAPHPTSSLGYEVGTIVGAAFVIPVALIHAGISSSRGTPIVDTGHALRPRRGFPAFEQARPAVFAGPGPGSS